MSVKKTHEGVYEITRLDGEKVVLSETDILDIYRYQERQFRLCDAKRHLCESVCPELEDYELEEYFEGGDFPYTDNYPREKFGVELRDLVNKDSEEYILDLLVDEFEDDFDCNVPENEIWESIVSRYWFKLAEEQKEKQKKEQEKEMLKILVFEPGKIPYVKEIKYVLEEMQAVVGGLIEVVDLGDVLVVANEEGKIVAEPEPNFVLEDSDGKIADIICGTAFLCCDDGEEFSSITEELIEKYKDKFPRALSATDSQMTIFF